MATRDEDYWIIGSNDGTPNAETHPVCLRLCRTDGGTMVLDLRLEQAAMLAKWLEVFLATEGGAIRGMSFTSRQGLHTVGGRDGGVVCFRKADWNQHGTTMSQPAEVPKGCVARLADGMTAMVLELAGHRASDPMGGARRRTDDNLRGVFG